MQNGHKPSVRQISGKCKEMFWQLSIAVKYTKIAISQSFYKLETQNFAWKKLVETQNFAWKKLVPNTDKKYFYSWQ